jgi:hypothetical protein
VRAGSLPHLASTAVFIIRLHFAILFFALVVTGSRLGTRLTRRAQARYWHWLFFGISFVGLTFYAAMLVLVVASSFAQSHYRGGATPSVRAMSVNKSAIALATSGVTRRLRVIAIHRFHESITP